MSTAPGNDRDPIQPGCASLDDASLEETALDDDESTGAPICAACGVTALPSEAPGAEPAFVCENPDCEAFGQTL